MFLHDRSHVDHPNCYPQKIQRVQLGRKFQVPQLQTCLNLAQACENKWRARVPAEWRVFVLQPCPSRSLSPRCCWLQSECSYKDAVLVVQPRMPPHVHQPIRQLLSPLASLMPLVFVPPWTSMARALNRPVVALTRRTGTLLSTSTTLSAQVTMRWRTIVREVEVMGFLAIWPFGAPFINKPNLKGWGQTPRTSPNWVHAAGVKSFASSLDHHNVLAYCRERCIGGMNLTKWLVGWGWSDVKDSRSYQWAKFGPNGLPGIIFHMTNHTRDVRRQREGWWFLFQEPCVNFV